MTVRIQESAPLRLDEIYRCTRNRWRADQADRYITDLFVAFNRIEGHGVASRPIPAEFGVEDFYFRQEHHFVYWRRLSDGDMRQQKEWLEPLHLRLSQPEQITHAPPPLVPRVNQTEPNSASDLIGPDPKTQKDL